MAAHSRTRLLATAIVIVALILLSHLVDQPVAARGDFSHVLSRYMRYLLMSMGYLVTWIIAAVALVLIDWPKTATRFWRGGYLLGCAAVAGGAAELLKLLVRRTRPEFAEVGSYAFRSFHDHPWSTSGLGMASSHAAVAGGAAFALCLLLPRAALVWIALAVGCALTRVALHAHYVSDVCVGLILGYLSARLFWRFRPRIPGTLKRTPP